MKVFKQNNKLIVYLPLDLSKNLDIKDGDEIDFLPYSDKAFLVAKKSDLAGLITGASAKPRPIEPETPKTAQSAEKTTAPNYQVTYSRTPSLVPAEISVLKKLDTLRFQQRTVDGVGKILDAKESELLKSMLNRKIITLFEKDGKKVYSIPSSVYDAFLMRKKEGAPAAAPTVNKTETKIFVPKLASTPTTPSEILALEQRGFLVITTEGEAARVSLILEESIRRGFVLGTRAFNKKFFIATRGFIDKQVPGIFKKLREGESKVSDIAAACGIDDDGARAVLYILAESGDIREKRKDLFAMA